VHVSPFEALHLNANVGPGNGSGFGDELTFDDLLFAHGKQAGDDGGPCLAVDASRPLANCTQVIWLQQGTITAAGLTEPPPRNHLAVTGGTGSYRNASGKPP
jgi:hypothetical protein